MIETQLDETRYSVNYLQQALALQNWLLAKWLSFKDRDISNASENSGKLICLARMYIR